MLSDWTDEEIQAGILNGIGELLKLMTPKEVEELIETAFDKRDSEAVRKPMSPEKRETIRQLVADALKTKEEERLIKLVRYIMNLDNRDSNEI